MNLNVIGHSRLGLPILAYPFGKLGRKVLILGGVHGDEVEGVLLAQALLAKFMQNFPFSVQLWMIPEFNVDGVHLKTRGNFKGIDLNRNLPTKDWSPHIATPRYHPGPSANSEPETQALVGFLQTEKIEFILSLHSWKPLINPNGQCLTQAEILKEHTGYNIEAEMGYSTPGCLGTYAGIEQKIPTITLEIERGLDPESILRLHVPAIMEMLKSL